MSVLTIVRSSLLVIFVLIAFSARCAVEVVVDNDAGAPGYAETGGWSTSGSTGYMGGTYRVSTGVLGAPTASATWTPNLPASGTYCVYAAFRNGTNRTTSAPVTITHTTGTTILALNQYGTGVVAERFLGEFSFDAGMLGSVRMDNNGTTAVHIADAMIWRVPVDPPPTIASIGRDQEVPTQAAPVIVTATITDNTAVTSASVSYTVSPAATAGSVPAYDDGSHGDGAAGDHVYGATIPAQPDGSTVAYSFTATDSFGQSSVSPVSYYAVGPLGPTIADVVVDNDDGAPGYVETGGWTTSSSTGYAGGTYRYIASVSGAPTGSATWTANLPRSGVYRVYAAYPRGTNRTTSAPMTITHAAGQATVALNQYGDSGIVEILLGEYPFETGTSASVRMENNGAAGACIADAMIWRLPSDAPPVVTQLTRNPVAPGSSDFVTVTARVMDNNAVTSAAVCFTVNPGAVSTVVRAWDDGAHGDGAAGDHVYGATIPAQPDNSVVRFYCIAWDSVGQSAVSPAQYYVVGQAPHNVYVVPSSDTSVWGFSSGPNPTIPWGVFESRSGVLSKLYDADFRNAHVDSFGRPFKITWFMHGGAWFRAAVNSTPISATYHIRKNWGDGITTYGDALEYHFHHYVYDSDWVMAPTFAETIWEYEWVMSQMILDERLFITAFRSGWNYMDNPYQQYLERWVPFRMEGVQANWVPYHPSFSDWKAPGTMKGWEARHIYTKSLSQSLANSAFLRASQGTDQVVCVWSHQNEADFPDQIAAVDGVLHTAATLYPSVQFHYCTADEAMQKWLGHTPSAPPPLEVHPSIAGDAVGVIVRTADDIYQEQPWVAARRYAGDCVRLDCVKTAPGTWRFGYSKREYDHVAVGVSDIHGTEAIAEVDDGSRRWAMQSEFARGRPRQVDFDTSPTCAMLARPAGSYLTSGTLTFDHTTARGGEWQTIAVDGDTPAGTSLLWCYKTADSQELLNTAPWSVQQAGRSGALPPGLGQSWIRIEVLLEGTASATPVLNSVEVTYDGRVAAADPGLWTFY